jgi:GTP-binding protein
MPVHLRNLDIPTDMGSIVAIVGRPNVGKSTFFNRLIGFRKAIVDQEAGVTRDRHYGITDWNGKKFSVIDTGGYVVNSEDVFEEEIRKQVKLAIDEADSIMFLVDATTDITDLDMAVAEILRKCRKKVFLVANKTENFQEMSDAQVFYRLGLGEVFCISAMTGSGTGDLLDKVVESFPEGEAEVEEPDIPRFAIVGRPNVGKSSLLNVLIGEERHIVTPVAGTTRDSIFTRYNKFGMDFFLIDTAGLRKKNKVHEDIEFYSVMRSVRTIENSDVCLFLIDGEQGFEAQDMNIFKLIESNQKGVVLVVNKWDLVEKDQATSKAYTDLIRKKLQPFNDVPIVFTSVLNRQRIHKVLEIANEVFQNRTRKIPTSELNRVMLEAIQAYPPPSAKGKYIRFKYVTQLPTHAPCFAFFCNLPQYVKEPYKRFLENRLREEFPLTGVPVQIFIRKK